MADLSAIIFDFDGVIADTERLHLRAFQEVLAEEGVQLTAAEYDARYLGREDSDVFRDVYRHGNRPLDDGQLQKLLDRKSERYDRLAGAETLLIDGVASRVAEWSALVPLAIASGARRVEVETVLRTTGMLSCFAAIVTAEDVHRGKPAPDPYLAALDRLAALHVGERTAETSGRPLERGSVVAIEDSPSGLASARAAGLRIVAVTTNYPAHLLAGAHLVVTSVAALDLHTLRRLVA